MSDMREVLSAVMTPRRKRYVVAVAVAVGASATGWMVVRLSTAHATPPSAAPSAPPASARPAPAATPPPAAPSSDPVAEAAAPVNSQITLFTVPPSYAAVTWGRTLLGRITPGHPLVLVRPRDSGPLDLVVRATGFIPVHTRAHTFADTSVAVKLTKPDDKDTLFGYRAPPDAGAPDEDAQAPVAPNLPQPPGAPQPVAPQPPPAQPPP